MKLNPTSIILKTIATVIGIAGLAINAWFARNLGATDIALAQTYMEDSLRLVLHLIMSQPEYQLD